MRDLASGLGTRIPSIGLVSTCDHWADCGLDEVDLAGSQPIFFVERLVDPGLREVLGGDERERTASDVLRQQNGGHKEARESRAQILGGMRRLMLRRKRAHYKIGFRRDGARGHDLDSGKYTFLARLISLPGMLAGSLGQQDLPLVDEFCPFSNLAPRDPTIAPTSVQIEITCRVPRGQN